MGLNEIRGFGFADDLFVLAWGRPRTAKRRLETFLEDLQTFYDRNGISINVGHFFLLKVENAF